MPAHEIFIIITIAIYNYSLLHKPLQSLVSNRAQTTLSLLCFDPAYACGIDTHF